MEISRATPSETLREDCVDMGATFNFLVLSQHHATSVSDGAEAKLKVPLISAIDGGRNSAPPPAALLYFASISLTSYLELAEVNDYPESRVNSTRTSTFHDT